jgi:methionine sulfoxide reductase catalytic subunit
MPNIQKRMNHMKPISPSEITPEQVYLNRRKFMVGVGSAAVLGTALLSGCAAPGATGGSGAATAPEPQPPVAESELPAPLAYDEPYATSATDELGDPLNEYKEITTYNNYYEFSTDKQEVSRLSGDFETRPWQLEVSGLVKNPRSYSMDDILANIEQEERIYRLRCVEAWSMVIPWVGFPISAILNEVEPTAAAKYVKFTTVMRPEQMPGQTRRILNWPYVEGLRLDEAMHPLAILATGMYGKPLTVSNGAPIRLMVPWKYGFKSGKSIVSIELVEEMPVSAWMEAAPNEYGFYANVNPEVNHPRWSQASERRIGESGRRDTLMFNGYADEVAYLYEGMDLRQNY